MILVDTSVWIDYFRGRDSREAMQLVAALEADENICICGPILMEIRQGIASDRDARNIERRMSPLMYLPTLRKTYRRAADIYRAARVCGKTIRNSVDCLIAACAIENHAMLLHRDRDYTIIAEVSELKTFRSR